ncbi:neuroligin-2-like [Bacillus rossius redtenbacheri]|uniref:neuroligin-2-like n=1 Tax=Bacillus rossius redtenbacheri TaxID=93214 RepID=UPI002FDE2898
MTRTASLGAASRPLTPAVAASPGRLLRGKQPSQTAATGGAGPKLNRTTSPRHFPRREVNGRVMREPVSPLASPHFYSSRSENNSTSRRDHVTALGQDGARTGPGRGQDGARTGPGRGQDGARTGPGRGQDGTRTGPGRDQDGARTGPGRGQDGARTGPGRGQDGARTGPGRGQDGARTGPGRGQDGARTGPGRDQDGARTGPGRGQDGARTGPGRDQDGARTGPGRGQDGARTGPGRDQDGARTGPGRGQDGARTGPGRDQDGARTGPGRGQDGARTGPGRGQDGTRTGPGRGQDGARTGPGRGQDGTRTGPGPGQDGARTGPGRGQDGTRTGPGRGQDGARTGPGRGQDGARTGPGRDQDGAVQASRTTERRTRSSVSPLCSSCARRRATQSIRGGGGQTPAAKGGGGRGDQGRGDAVDEEARLVRGARMLLWAAVALQLLAAGAGGGGGGGGGAARVVRTKHGRLQGVAVAGRRPPVDAYLGVPYASPPVGAARFSPTRAPPPWDGVRRAERSGPACPQRPPDVSDEEAALARMPRGRLEQIRRLLPFLREQSEDCLYLNVYAPRQDEGSQTLYPVVVYIHGESYEWNSGNPYDGSVLAGYGHLVVVTVNYRLGVLGFLNANSEPRARASVANYGLMDQIAALHWVQQNIAGFGGDPGSVTLMGHGTGAACVGFLITSPAVVPGLFHRAILMSGSPLSSWATVEDPVSHALLLARRVNCSVPEDPRRGLDAVVDCLREAPLEALLGAEVTAPSYLPAFGPSVDGVVVKTDLRREMLANPKVAWAPPPPAAPAAPGGKDRQRGGGGESALATLAALAGTNRCDLLFGVVTGEALWRFSSSDVQSGFEGAKRDRMLRTYVRNAYSYHVPEIFFTLVNEYTDWERTVQHPVNTRDATVLALSDAEFVAPLVQLGDVLSYRVSPGASTNKHYFYVFDYQTKDSDYPQRLGTAHGEELPYVFGAPLAYETSAFYRNYTKSEVALSESLMIYVSKFARTGNPNLYQKKDSVLPVSRERNRFRNLVWDEYDSIHQKYLEISMKPRMRNHFRSHHMSVWLRLVPELHRAGMRDAAARHNLFREQGDERLYQGSARRPPPQPRNDTAAASTPASPAACAPPPAATPRRPDPAPAQGQPHPAAFSVAVAVGCSLLVLNVVIFAVIYYQRDRMRCEAKDLQERARRAHCQKSWEDLEALPAPGSPRAAVCPAKAHHRLFASPRVVQHSAPERARRFDDACPLNGSATFLAPARRQQPPKGILRAPAAAMNEMRV